MTATLIKTDSGYRVKLGDVIVGRGMFKECQALADELNASPEKEAALLKVRQQ